MSLPKAMIIDLDGTLCDHQHRLHHIDPSKRDDCYYFPEPSTLYQSAGWYYKDDVTFPIARVEFEPDYNRYWEAMSQDKPIAHIWEILSLMSLENRSMLIFSTDRPERYRKATMDWIQQYLVGTAIFDESIRLFMRSSCEEDTRSERDVKEETYKNEIEGKYDVTCVLENDDRCACMYRDLGLRTLLVLL